jgi:hypothetical protein
MVDLSKEGRPQKLAGWQLHGRPSSERSTTMGLLAANAPWEAICWSTFLRKVDRRSLQGGTLAVDLPKEGRPPGVSGGKISWRSVFWVDLPKEGRPLKRAG